MDRAEIGLTSDQVSPGRGNRDDRCHGPIMESPHAAIGSRWIMMCDEPVELVEMVGTR